MKKVLWMVSWYPSRLDMFNGDFIQRHARAVSLYCDVYVIYVVKDENKVWREGNEELVTGNLRERIIFYHSPKTGIGLLDRYLSQLKYMRSFKQAIKEYINANGIPDQVHVHIAMKAGLAALWAKKKWKVPFLVTEHWTGYYPQSKPSVYDSNPLFRLLNRRILKEASLFLPVTKNLGETVKNNFINVSYRVVPNVVNTELFYYKPFRPTRFRFIHFSYMNYQKNPDGILDAVKLLKEKGCDFELLMIGQEDDRLISKTENNGLSEIVSFHAVVPYCDVAKQMQMASAFLLFSRFENLPCVILEALCCGLPVISSNVGGISEVINAQNGILVANENINQLADAMQQVIENYAAYDKQRISDIAKEKFSYTAVGAQYFSTYCDTPG